MHSAKDIRDIPVAAEIFPVRAIVDKIIFESTCAVPPAKPNPINVIIVADKTMRDLIDPHALETDFPFGKTDGVYNGAYLIIGDRHDIGDVVAGIQNEFHANIVRINWYNS